MTGTAVAGFAPSRNGFHFANRWPSGPALVWQLGLVHVGIGDAARGLCGGMVFAARDRFERGETPPEDASAPAAGSALFREIVDRQIDSFDRLVVVPFRFWAGARRDDKRRLRETVTDAWPAIRSELDAGRLAMVGLVRASPGNPF